MNNQMPPMDMPQQPMGDEMPPMDGDMNNNQGEENFDTDFNAGVEADESNDPKRYIQQLAGKLSQSLRKYNEGLPNPDADLNKYVAGMTNDAAVEGMSPEEVEEIINKIKSDETKDDGSQEMSQDNMSPMDNNQEPPMGNDMMPMENRKNSKKHIKENIETLIDEIMNNVLSNTPKNTNDIKTSNKVSFKTKPYSSPTFK